jgi:hypothetical protein
VAQCGEIVAPYSVWLTVVRLHAGASARCATMQLGLAALHRSRKRSRVFPTYHRSPCVHASRYLRSLRSPCMRPRLGGCPQQADVAAIPVCTAGIVRGADNALQLRLWTRLLPCCCRRFFTLVDFDGTAANVAQKSHRGNGLSFVEALRAR